MEPLPALLSRAKALGLELDITEISAPLFSEITTWLRQQVKEPTANARITSYGIRQAFQNDKGHFHVSHDLFLLALLATDFRLTRWRGNICHTNIGKIIYTDKLLPPGHDISTL